MTDGGGLYLFVAPSGAKAWRFDFRFLGRRQTLSIGPYPEVSLKEARKRHTDARRQLEANANPAILKQQDKRAQRTAASNTFESVANEWLQEVKPHRSRGWACLIEGWFRITSFRSSVPAP